MKTTSAATYECIYRQEFAKLSSEMQARVLTVKSDNQKQDRMVDDFVRRVIELAEHTETLAPEPPIKTNHMVTGESK